ncbi:MAG TPA: AAA family ATPase [Planctomycetota bacterium]|nr:AAA family ATPase [Planctomycetota bacterium]
MLLRLRIQGFKNLRDVDVRFGPLTCFVGPNGVGKSNVFDAIQFLRHLADDEIQKAAEAIRQPTEGSFSALDLITNRDPGTDMRFVADMLAPLRVEDDFGQPVEPTASLLTYTVAFHYSPDENRLVLIEEELKHQKKGDATKVILFPHSRSFRDSVVKAERFGTAFISTKVEGGQPRIVLHGDGGSRGRPVPAGPSPRTILGGTGSKEHPTVVAARREMASWHSVHLEPSSLRTPDRFGETAPVDEYGRHIAATLRRLGRERLTPPVNGSPGTNKNSDAMQQVCAEAANQLARLVAGVDAVRVHEDEARQHYVVEVRFRESELWMPPRALSEGTLRYLALVAMQMDTRSSRVLCIEEPENGIEPRGIPALMRLLSDYAADPEEPVDPADNPLRQVVVNSHSPGVVSQLPATEVLFVESVKAPSGTYARIRPVDYPELWRPDEDLVSREYFQHWVGGLPRGQMYLP